MKELNDIIVAYNNAVLQQKKTVLATVVHVRGSSYRRPGARMLVTEEGEITGAISGGCLEGDALRKAQLAIHQQKNKLEIYDTTNEDDKMLGIQLGCNGVVYILFEPIDEKEENNPIQLLKQSAADRQEAVLISVFNPDKNAIQQGTCCLVKNREQLFLNERQDWTTELSTVFEQRASRVSEGADNWVLFQFIPPAIQLVIIGAGNDVQPLCKMAAILGWKLVICDGRPAYATRLRFPNAHDIIVARPPALLSAVDLDQHTAVVLMTHNFNYDVDALQQLLRYRCPYIGVLGPRQKMESMLEALLLRGEDKHILQLQQNLHGPVGLDIGAETAEEIALSIIAEIKAVFTQRQGGMLKNLPSTIHARHFVAG